MFESSAPKDKIIAAALRLAETRPWLDLSLGEIAAGAGIPLIEFKKDFPSKAKILAAFTKAVDEELLRRFPAPGADVARDRIFDVILTRFEIMQPYKAALLHIRTSIGNDAGASLAQLKASAKSQYWMLAASGLSGEGSTGFLRVQGMLAIYADVFSVWIDDDDPGMARTMAALDRRLRRAEAAIERVQSIRDGIHNFARNLGGERGHDTKEKGAGTEPNAATDFPSESSAQAI